MKNIRGTSPITLLDKCAYDPVNRFYTNRGLSAKHNGADYGTRGVAGVPVPALMAFTLRKSVYDVQVVQKIGAENDGEWRMVA